MIVLKIHRLIQGISDPYFIHGLTAVHIFELTQVEKRSCWTTISL